MSLLRHQLRTELVSLVIWSLSLGALVFYTVVMWQQLKNGGGLAALEEMLRNMPPAFKGLYGSAFNITQLTGWLQGYAFGGYLNLIYSIYVGLFAAGMVTREVDQRTLEFLLALPVTRAQLLLSRWLGMVVSLVCVHLTHLLGVVLGVLTLGQKPAWGNFLVASLNSLLLYVAIGGLLLAVTLFINDYGPAVGSSIGIATGLYLLYSLTESSTGLVKGLRKLDPYALFNAGPIIGNGEIPWSNMAILSGVAAAALALSLYLFQRKQITA